MRIAILRFCERREYSERCFKPLGISVEQQELVMRSIQLIQTYLPQVNREFGVF
jgi:hypothetical protein